MPSKALLHAAAIHAAGGDYPWPRASDFRDWMIVRERPRDWPDDGGHITDLETAGATVFRGEGRLDGPGGVVVRTTDGDRRLEAKAVLIAVGSNATVPDDIEGLDQITPWTNRQATTARELPRSLVVLGAGPTGVELSQVFAPQDAAAGKPSEESLFDAEDRTFDQLDAVSADLDAPVGQEVGRRHSISG